MSAAKSHRAKVVLTSALGIFSLAFAAQLLWLRQVGPISPSPLALGLFALTPLGTTVAFLGLWHLSLRRRSDRSTVAAIPFWLISTLCLVFWAAFFSIFVIGPASGAAA
jgi:bacteriorhodopsin